MRVAPALGVAGLLAATVMAVGAPAARAAHPDAYAPEILLSAGVGGGGGGTGVGPLLGVHAGGFPARVLYLGGFAGHQAFERGDGVYIAGVELGARYVKHRSPRFTGLVSGSLLFTDREPLFIVGLGLRIDFLLGRRLILGGAVHWGVAPGPLFDDDEGGLPALASLRLNVGLTF